MHSIFNIFQTITHVSQASWIKTDSVIRNLEFEPIWRLIEIDVQTTGLSMTQGIIDDFLDNPKNMLLYLLG